MDRLRGALASFRRSLALCEQLSREHPTISHYRSGVAVAHQSIGWAFDHEARPAEAITEYELAVPIHERLAADNPTVTQYQAAAALTHANIGDKLRELGRFTEALEHLQQAFAMYQRLVGANPGVHHYWSGMVTTVVQHAALFNQMNKPAEARQQYKRAAAIYEESPVKSPADLYNFACIHAQLGDLTPSKAGDDPAKWRAAASAHYDRAMITLRQAFDAGQRQYGLYLRDTDLDPLRRARFPAPDARRRLPGKPLCAIDFRGKPYPARHLCPAGWAA